MTLAELYLKYADKYRKKGEYEKAVDEYIRAIKTKELTEYGAYSTLVDIAICFTYIKNWDEAKDSLDFALEIATEHNFNLEIVYYNYGNLYFEQHDFSTALKYFKQAIRIDEGNVYSWMQSGLCYYNQGSPKEAVDTLETALKFAISKGSKITETIKDHLNAAKARLAVEEGKEYFNKKNFELALGKFNFALDLNHEIVEKDTEQLGFIHFMKGQCFLELKDLGKASEEFDKASALSVMAELAVLDIYGKYYYYKRDFKNSLIYYSNGLKRCKDANQKLRDKWEVNFATGVAFSQTMIVWAIEKNGHGALKIIESAKPFNNWDVNIKTLLKGKILYSLEKYWESITCLKELLDSDIPSASALGYAFIGCSYQKMGHYETALRHMEKGMSKHEIKNSTVWVSKGECHLHLKQYGEALEAYRKALEVQDIEDEYTAPEIEAKIKAVKQLLSQTERDKEAKKRPTHITIQGNNNPINFGGILATDDAVINRPTIQKEEEEVITAFCPQCGCKVGSEDRFCRKCGGKLK